MIVSTLVDSNVLLDISAEDGVWIDWSASMLADAGQRGPLVINPIVYAEVSTGYATVEALDDALPVEYYTRAPLPWAAAFLAGKCFQAYRRRGGVKRSPLPDFYIGAHAAVAGMTLLTRDARRYKTYFPKLRIIAP